MKRAARRGLVVLAAASVVTLGALGAACDNMLTGKLTPVPPVHRVPPDSEGTVILVDQDAAIESKDPVHHARAKEKRVPQDLRAAMVEALVLAGFKVVDKSEMPHDLVARVAINVVETDGKVKQTYRCGLKTKDGSEVAQIDWTWPEGTYVDSAEVYAFATHNVATEIATSRRVNAWVKAQRGARPVFERSQDAGERSPDAQ